jgi:hypothetical protein
MPRRRPLLALTAAALTTAVLLPAASAHADVVNVWTTYPSMGACKTSLLNLNDYCFGLQDGSALGFIDAGLILDESSQALGRYYDDENNLPAPEGPANPVVEVWNNTDDYTFLTAGTSFAATAADGGTIYYIPPHADEVGEVPVDADQGNASHVLLSKRITLELFCPVDFHQKNFACPLDIASYQY